MLNTIRKFWSGLAASLRQPAAPSRIIQLTTAGRLPRRHPPKFDHILIVDDIPVYAQASLETIRQFYHNSELTVYISHSFAAALALFQQYDIKLVILDLDLDDLQGDGAMLLRNFRLQRPEITVLANSSERRYNELLLEGGAAAVLAKDINRLRQWLADNG